MIRHLIYIKAPLNRLTLPLMEVGALSQQSRKLALLGFLVVLAALSIGCSDESSGAPLRPMYEDDDSGEVITCPSADGSIFSCRTAPYI